MKLWEEVDREDSDIKKVGYLQVRCESKGVSEKLFKYTK